MTARSSFAERLRVARELIARGAQHPSGHVADQLAAAAADTRRLHDRIGVVMPLLEPGRDWRQRVAPSPSAEVRAYLLAGVLGCKTVCPHLRKGGPQPALVMLPLRRIACLRCAATIRRPVTAPDQCDVCERRGVVTFVPFACHQGPALITGDACRACADILGIRSEVAS
jgi:hypothetical protein